MAAAVEDDFGFEDDDWSDDEEVAALEALRKNRPVNLAAVQVDLDVDESPRARPSAVPAPAAPANPAAAVAVEADDDDWGDELDLSAAQVRALASHAAEDLDDGDWGDDGETKADSDSTHTTRQPARPSVVGSVASGDSRGESLLEFLQSPSSLAVPGPIRPSEDPPVLYTVNERIRQLLFQPTAQEDMVRWIEELTEGIDPVFMNGIDIDATPQSIISTTTAAFLKLGSKARLQLTPRLSAPFAEPTSLARAALISNGKTYTSTIRSCGTEPVQFFLTNVSGIGIPSPLWTIICAETVRRLFQGFKFRECLGLACCFFDVLRASVAGQPLSYASSIAVGSFHSLADSDVLALFHQALRVIRTIGQLVGPVTFSDPHGIASSSSSLPQHDASLFPMAIAVCETALGDLFCISNRPCMQAELVLLQEQLRCHHIMTTRGPPPSLCLVATHRQLVLHAMLSEQLLVLDPTDPAAVPLELLAVGVLSMAQFTALGISPLCFVRIAGVMETTTLDTVTDAVDSAQEYLHDSINSYSVQAATLDSPRGALQSSYGFSEGRTAHSLLASTSSSLTSYVEEPGAGLLHHPFCKLNWHPAKEFEPASMDSVCHLLTLPKERQRELSRCLNALDRVPGAQSATSFLVAPGWYLWTRAFCLYAIATGLFAGAATADVGERPSSAVADESPVPGEVANSLQAFAEAAAFECLQILHHTHMAGLVRLPPAEFGSLVPSAWQQSCVLSDMGSNVIALLALIMVQRSKYQLALCAMETAVKVFVSRGPAVADRIRALLRRMAVVSAEHGDRDRALVYFRQTLDQCKAAKEFNEVVFIAHVMTDMLLDGGDLDMARALLSDCIAFLQSAEPGTDMMWGANVTLRSQVHQVQLHYARVCAAVGHADEAICMLRSLFQSLPPRRSSTIKASAMLVLAECLLITRQFGAFSQVSQALTDLLAAGPILQDGGAPFSRDHGSSSVIGHISDRPMSHRRAVSAFPQLSRARRPSAALPPANAAVRINGALSSPFQAEMVHPLAIKLLAVREAVSAGRYVAAIQQSAEIIVAMENEDAPALVGSNATPAVWQTPEELVTSAARPSNSLRRPGQSASTRLLPSETGMGEGPTTNPLSAGVSVISPAGSQHVPFALGRQYYNHGKILQAAYRAASQIDFPFTVTAGISGPDCTEGHVSVRLPSPFKAKGRKYCGVGDLIWDALNCFRRAYQCFFSFGDDIRIAKTAARMAQVYLEHLFVPVCLLKVPMEQAALIAVTDHRASSAPSTMPSSPTSQGGERDVMLSLGDAASPAQLSLEISVRTCVPMQLLDSHLTVAEVYMLQGRTSDSLAHWIEARDLFLTLFVNGASIPVARVASEAMLDALHDILSRMVRFLWCFERAVLNANLLLLDVYLVFQYDFARATRRPHVSLADLPGIQPPAQTTAPTPLSKLPAPSATVTVPPVLPSLFEFPDASMGSTTQDAASSSDRLQRLRGTSISRSRSRSRSRSATAMGHVSIASTEDVTRLFPGVAASVAAAAAAAEGSDNMSKRSAPPATRRGRESSITLHSVASEPRALSAVRRESGPSRGDSSSRFSGTRSGSAAPTMSQVGTRATTSHIVGDSAAVMSLWGCLFQIDRQTQAYAAGEIPSSSLRQQNRSVLANMCRILARLRSAASQPNQDEFTYERLMRSHGSAGTSPDDTDGRAESGREPFGQRLSRVVYLIHAHNLILAYSPATGQSQVVDTSRGAPDVWLTYVRRHLMTASRSMPPLQPADIRTSLEAGQAATGCLRRLVLRVLDTNFSESHGGGPTLASLSPMPPSVVIEADETGWSDAESAVSGAGSAPHHAHTASGGAASRVAPPSETQVETPAAMPVYPAPRQNTSLFQKLKTSLGLQGATSPPRVPSTPVTLISSPTLHPLPWEWLLGYDLDVTRAQCLMAVVATYQMQHKEPGASGISLPRMYSSYRCLRPAGSALHLVAVEEVLREKCVLDTLMCTLDPTMSMPKDAPIVPQEAALLHAFHPLFHNPAASSAKTEAVLRKRYGVRFMPSGALSSEPLQVVSWLDIGSPGQEGRSWPLFILTSTDLVELSEPVQCLLGYRPDCTLLFVPAEHMVVTLRALADMWNRGAKAAKRREAPPAEFTSPYHMLMHCLTQLRVRKGVSVVMFNPPV